MTARDAAAWNGRVAIISPHLDDAVLSLGASIHAAARRGVRVEVITVLAGDPASTTPSDDSNRRAGFATAGEAATARREEDRRACAAVGATPVWLGLSDDRNEEEPDDDAIREHVDAAVAGCDAVLLPGFPLGHPHHLRVARLTLDLLDDRIIGFYVEQPYASWEAFARGARPFAPESRGAGLAKLGVTVDGDAGWHRERLTPADVRAKWRGMSAYASQLRVLRRAPRARILGYEALRRGEAVLWAR